jgi:methylmalonyl-CoA epimerase
MIKAISHLGVAVKNLEEARDFYRKVFGIESSEPIIGGGGNVRISMVELANAVVELLEPVGGESPVGKFLASRGEGIHHICYDVDDIHAEVENLKSRGLDILGAPKPGAEGLSVFIHPKGTHGVLVELVQKGTEKG